MDAKFKINDFVSFNNRIYQIVRVGNPRKFRKHILFFYNIEDKDGKILEGIPEKALNASESFSG